MRLFIALALAVGAHDMAPAQPGAIPSDNQGAESTQIDPDANKLERAVGLIKAGQPADGIGLLDEIITTLEARHPEHSRQFFCARSMPETIVYAGMAVKTKQAVAVLDQTWCYSYFYKGYALIDLGRRDEAKPYFDKAVALAPMNAQFLAERGEWYKSRKDWDAAYKDFEAAASYANFSPERVKSFEQRRGWRGMAYVRTEQGKLDEALGLLQECLKLEPSDDKCQHEVSYVNGLKSKAN